MIFLQEIFNLRIGKISAAPAKSVLPCGVVNLCPAGALAQNRPRLEVQKATTTILNLDARKVPTPRLDLRVAAPVLRNIA